MADVMADAAIVAPPLVASWQAPVLDAGKVHDEIDRLWAEWGAAQGGRTESDSAAPVIEGAQMRASTLNLIAIADAPADAAKIEATVSQLIEFSPSRTVILVRDGKAGGEGGGLDVRVAVHEHGLGKGQPAIRCESVTVAAAAGSDEVLASVTSPLLVPELPDFLWSPRDSYGSSRLFAELVELADRLIVDTAAVSAPGESLRFLAELTKRPRPCPKLSDVVWTRLTAWRQLIAQFFDQPPAQPCLEAIDQVAVAYGAPGADGASGLTAGLLIAGWLATRLGWRAPGELVRSRDGWRLTLRAGSRGRGREIILTLKPTDAPAARRCLGSVTLTANGDAPGEFTVERADAHGITTTSETATMPRVSRMVYGMLPDDRTLLSQELRMFGRDPVFEEALVFASELWPEGVAG